MKQMKVAHASEVEALKNKLSSDEDVASSVKSLTKLQESLAHAFNLDMRKRTQPLRWLRKRMRLVR